KPAENDALHSVQHILQTTGWHLAGQEIKPCGKRNHPSIEPRALIGEIAVGDGMRVLICLRSPLQEKAMSIAPEQVPSPVQARAFIESPAGFNGRLFGAGLEPNTHG